jgi:hypothetical protein
MKKKKNKRYEDQTQGKKIIHHGSATQGGSNFGQGSSHLGSDANKQGSVSGRGSNYDNEKDTPNGPYLDIGT